MASQERANHKYIKREMGPDGKWQYIYPGDTTKSINDRNVYADQKARLKRLKAKQKELEGQIDDDSLSDKEKEKRTLEAGDKLDKTLDRIDRLRAKMKKMQKEYRKENGRRISDDMNPDKPKTDNLSQKQIRAQLEKLRAQSAQVKNKMQESETKSQALYNQSDNYKSQKNERGYQISGIVGKKYESAARRYADKLNTMDRRIAELEKRLNSKGETYIAKILKGR